MYKLLHHIFTKWLPAAILVFPIISKIGRILPLSSMAMSHMNLICALVSQLRETQALACGGGGGDWFRTKTIISPKFQISGVSLSYIDTNSQRRDYITTVVRRVYISRHKVSINNIYVVAIFRCVVDIFRLNVCSCWYFHICTVADSGFGRRGA